MTTENSGTTEKTRTQVPPKLLTKPLPQILDEMETNIRAAAEAARRAEEAAKAARQAAGAANKASEEVAKRADETREAADKVLNDTAKAEMLQRIEALEERLKSIEDAIPEEKIVVLRQISKEEAEKEILELFSQGQTLYYSDIAEKLGLDLRMVVEICNELQSKGEIEVVEDALQRSR